MQNADSASRGTFCPELLKPSALACQLSLLLSQGKSGIWAVWEPKRPRDITSATTLRICEVTQHYLSWEGKGLGASGDSQKGLELLSSRAQGKLFWAHFFPKIEL